MTVAREIAAPREVSRAERAAAVVYVVNAAGFGIGTLWTLVHLARHDELPMTPFGFRSLDGPFAALGWPRFTALGWAFTALCALDALTGVGIWRGRRWSPVLGFATTPAGLALGAGFALPFYLASIPIRLALLLIGRSARRRGLSG